MPRRRCWVWDVLLMRNVMRVERGRRAERALLWSECVAWSELESRDVAAGEAAL